MTTLADGTYDVIVVDVVQGDDAPSTIEVVIVSGPEKGMTAGVPGPSNADAGLALLGLPGTLTMTHGRARLTL